MNRKKYTIELTELEAIAVERSLVQSLLGKNDVAWSDGHTKSAGKRVRHKIFEAMKKEAKK